MLDAALKKRTVIARLQGEANLQLPNGTVCPEARMHRGEQPFPARPVIDSSETNPGNPALRSSTRRLPADWTDGGIPPCRFWCVFAGAIVLSFFIHEVGHCLVAWCHGCPAIPTLAKEYLLRPLPPDAQNAVSLGGIVGSIGAWAGGF